MNRDLRALAEQIVAADCETRPRAYELISDGSVVGVEEVVAAPARDRLEVAYPALAQPPTTDGEVER